MIGTSTRCHHLYPVQCTRCAALIGWPRWARVEHGHQQALCWPCYAVLDQNFTHEAAISQALIIVGVHQGALAVQR